ncbi:MAG: MFS transporter [Defluviitaleaceae bacterium]|nr:MFS transporter [Defluviitaleaceae bacterium]
MKKIVRKIKRAWLSGRSFVRSQPISVKYGIDGVLTLGAVSVVANNNNLFAQRLGAGDFHLSMLQFLPQMLNLFLLIPAGLLIDNLANKRRMLSAALMIAGVFFALAGGAAFLPVHSVYFFLVFLALANVSVGITNLTWQSYFPEVVPEGEDAWASGVKESRNAVLTFRARMTMIVSLVVPLSVGAILTSIQSDGGKIAAHQGFYILAAVMLLSNALHFRKIKAVKATTPKRISVAQLKTAAGRLKKNKLFIAFALTVLFFHMSWQMDWTLYFIGQRNYMLMGEVLLSLTPVGGMVAQLLTLKYWSRNNARQGVEFPIVYGILGLALCPIAMILGVSIPDPRLGIPVFLLVHTIGHLAFANITLNLFQCLLKVVDEEYRSFSISVYTLLITLSNAVMPVAGVAIYRALGGNRQGLVYTFAILFIIRIAAAGLWLIYLRYAKKLGEAAHVG